MAGAGWRDFVPGEVLTAANVQDYLQDQAVMVFASAAARTSAIASPTDGMVSYLKDTDTIERYNGSSWVVAFPIGNGGTGATTARDAQLNLRIGTVPISPSSIVQTGGSASVSSMGEVTFTGVTSIALNGVFSSTYRNYLITYNANNPSTAYDLHVRMRASGANSSVSYYWQRISGDGTTVAAAEGNNAPEGILTRSYGNTGFSGVIYSPNEARDTLITTDAFHSNNVIVKENYVNRHNVSTAYDGIYIFPGGSNNMTGTVLIQGILI